MPPAHLRCTLAGKHFLQAARKGCSHKTSTSGAYNHFHGPITAHWDGSQMPLDFASQWTGKAVPAIILSRCPMPVSYFPTATAHGGVSCPFQVHLLCVPSQNRSLPLNGATCPERELGETSENVVIIRTSYKHVTSTLVNQ